MKVDQKINEETMVFVREWTACGIIRIKEIPLRDVLPFYNENFTDEVCYINLADPDCRIFTIIDNFITFDDIIEDESKIIAIITKGNDYKVTIAKEKFSAHKYLKDCRIPEDKIPEIIAILENEGN